MHQVANKSWTDQVKEDIKSLCRIFISYFDDLKSKGAICEEEYIKHTRIKKDFLEKY